MIIFIVCLTGSLYAFRYQIESLVNHKSIYLKTPATSHMGVDLALAHFNQQFGGATYVTVLPDTDKSLIISSLSPAGPGVTAYYTPHTGTFIATKNESGIDFFEFVLDTHRFLLAGDTGKLINGISILIFVYMLLSGLGLWFPKKRRKWKQKLVIRWRARFYRLNYDLHSVLGFYSHLILLLIALTGLYVSFHWVKNLMIVGLGGNSIVISESNAALKKDLSDAFSDLLTTLSNEQQGSSDSSWSLHGALQQANAHFPQKGVRIIRLPNEHTNATVITVMSTENHLNFITPHTVHFSASGQVSKTIPFYALPLHEQFKVLAKPLHTGEIMGLPSIIIYFIASLIGCSLPITGFLMWWRKVSN